MGSVTCVCFDACGYRWALEARHVRRIDSTLSLARHAAFETLLCDSPGQPTRWLTLVDRLGPWQLGLPSDSILLPLPSAALHPLPPLLAARVRHPALCGIAVVAQSLTLLLNGAQLRLPTTSGSVGEP